MNLDQNRLFAQLAKADQASVRKLCQPFELSFQQVLSTPQLPDRRVYFLTGASVALVMRNAGTPGLALGLVGLEGAIGLQFALGLDSEVFTPVVQSPGRAWGLDGEALEQLAKRRPELLFALSKYLWTTAQEVAMFAAFAQFNDVKPRLAQWLLTSRERGTGDELALTQTHLAEMLGVRRASITVAAIELKAAGLVDYRRGKLVVLDVKGLAAVAVPVVRLKG